VPIAQAYTHVDEAYEYSKSFRSKHTRKESVKKEESVYEGEDIQEWPDYISLDSTDIRAGKKIKAGSVCSLNDRKNRANPAKIRLKFEKVSWNGLSSTFMNFQQAVEGHLLQVGAGYLTQSTFLGIYKQTGAECFKSDLFYKMYKIPVAQALYDRSYLYGILVSATSNMLHKTIIKYKEEQDGILAWDELKADFDALCLNL
jgi:hypothetical protein